MIASLQILRFVAAFMVVCSHIDDRLLGFGARYGSSTFQTGLSGDFGVRIFFVISGFIMVWISLNREPGPGPRDFFLDRVARVVPLYAVLTLAQAVFLWWAAGRGDTRAQANLDVWTLLSSLLFIPYLNGEGKHRPVLEQGWTLDYEMFFYALFALCLFAGKRRAPWLALGLLTGIWMAGSASLVPAPWSLIADGLLLNFAAGIVLGLIRLQVPPRWGHWLVLPAVVLIVTLGTRQIVSHGAFVTSLVAIAAVAACVLTRDMHGGRLAALFVRLGGASYSLYLLHGFVLLVVGMAWRKLFGGDLLPLYFMVCALLSVGTSVLCEQQLERPLSRAVKQWMNVGRRTHETAPS